MGEFLKKMREALGLPEDASEEAVLKAVAERNPDDGGEGEGGEGTPPAEGTPDPADGEGEGEGESPAEGEPTPEVKAAMEEFMKSNPVAKMLAEQNEALTSQNKRLEQRLTAVEAARRDEQITVQLTEWTRMGLPPAVANGEVKKALAEPSTTNIRDAIAAITKAGLTSVGQSRGGSLRLDEGSIDEHVEKGVKKLMEDNSDLDLVQAYDEFFAQNPEAYEAYRNGSYEFRDMMTTEA